MAETIIKKSYALASKFLPVIFANGKDDDLPGFVAAVENREFQFDEKTYAVSEPLVIVGRTLILSEKFITIIAHDESAANFPGFIIREGNPARKIDIVGCQVIMGVTPFRY